MKKEEKTVKERKSFIKRIQRFLKGHRVDFSHSGLPIIIGAFFALIVLFCTVNRFSDAEIGASVIRDINILLISTNATLIGLYVTAFIFLNDSLKARVKEDGTLSGAVEAVLDRYRKNMATICVLAVISILAEILNNIFIGGNDVQDFENLFISFQDWRFKMFIFVSVISIASIIWIIVCSRDITHSDKLITNYSKMNLQKYQEKIIESYERVVAAGSDLSKEGQLDELLKNSLTENSLLELAKSKNYSILDSFSILPEGEKTEENRKNAEYSFAIAYQRVKKNQRQKKNNNKINSDKVNEETETIILGKRVRFLEVMISKICENNIDKSIMKNQFVYKSIQSGFQWLYANGINDTKNNSHLETNTSPIIDVRDEKRFLDYIKYLVLSDEVFEKRPFINEEAEDLFKLAEVEFNKPVKDRLDFNKKANRINRYKENMRQIIADFFEGYENIVEYRDAMIHFRSFAEKDKRLDLKKLKDINVFAEILIRVLIDRFTSFVKATDLNLGNSTFDKGWFNYSEFSESNFTHSTFVFARIENAIFRNCDLSTCSFINADASGTDFRNCNFSYSNLTGMDLTNTLLDNSQMNAVIFRDRLIDRYQGLKELLERLIVEGRREKGYLDDLIETLKWDTSKQDYLKWKDASGTLDLSKIKKLLTLEDGEQSALLLEKNGNCALENVQAHLSKNIEILRNAHKYYKISKKYYQDLTLARRCEDITKEKKMESTGEHISVKQRRELDFGKVYFGVANLSAASVNEVSLKDIDFSHVKLDDASFKDSDLSNAEMYYTTATSAMFFRTNLNDLDAYHADFSMSNFSFANIINGSFIDCNLRATNFSKALLLNACIINTQEDLEAQCDPLYIKRFLEEDKHRHTYRDLFEHVTDEEIIHGEYTEDDAEKKRHITNLPDKFVCVDSVFIEAIANNITILNTNLMRSNFNKATLKDCFLHNNIMRWCEFVESILTTGLIVGTSFHHSNFFKADFSRAKLFGCELSNANFKETRMISVHLTKVLFEECNFEKCNFSSAKIENTMFNKCNFAQINISGCTFKNVVFSEIDFSNAIGLDQAVFKNCVFLDKNDRSEEKELLSLSDKIETGSVFVYEDLVDGESAMKSIPRYSTQK